MESIHGISVGMDVIVARGRKVPKGTTGRVTWMGENSFGYGWNRRTTTSVRITEANGTNHFTNITNCDACIEQENLFEKAA